MLLFLATNACQIECKKIVRCDFFLLRLCTEEMGHYSEIVWMIEIVGFFVVGLIGGIFRVERLG